jgi:hypothetical protein
MKSVSKIKKKFKIKPLRIAVNITGIISKSMRQEKRSLIALTQLSDNQYILKKKIIEILNTKAILMMHCFSC